MGSTGGPHLGYNRNAYPYGLPPNFTPPTMHENMDNVVPITFEGQPPQPIGTPAKSPESVPKLTSTHTPRSLSRDQHSMPCLNLILREPLNPARCNHYISL